MEKTWHAFLSLCLKAKNPNALEKLLDCFLTIEEKNDIIDRYLILKYLLEKQLTQRDIAQQLKVSISKITRGSNALKTIDDQLKIFLKREI